MIPLFVGFLLDAGMVGATAWMCLGVVKHDRRSLLELSLSWVIAGLSWIVASGVLLGLVGGLNRAGFMLGHAMGLAVLILWRRKWREDAQSWHCWLADLGRLLWSGTPEALIVWVLILSFLFLAALAAQAEPIIFDALTYRLPRIGQWLQDGRIANLAVDDARLNYMPVGPDLIIAWLLGATSEGFWLAPLSQLIGGGLLLGATFGLARTVGLNRLSALGAVAITLGMANVAVQFTTIQSDLFTAGVFSTSYLLWHRALLRGEGSWLGGVGIGLAWGSKGTMFYMVPGIALWVGWLMWRYRPALRAGWSTMTGAVAALLIFVGPSYLRNLAAYGSLFGPHESVVLHHGESLTLAQHAEKLRLNLSSSAIQLFDPTAQPFWCQDILREIGMKLLPILPVEDDRYLFWHELPRRALAAHFLGQSVPDADLLSCGVLVVGLFLAGVMTAGVRNRSEATAMQVLVWSAGVVGYVLVQHAMLQWHQFSFRFVVLVSPWMAVVGAWGISRLAPQIRLAVWVVILISSLQVFIDVQGRAAQAAWSALTRPDSALSHFVYRHWRAWAGELDRPEMPVRLAMKGNEPSSAFYRLAVPRRVFLERLTELRAESAETAVASGEGWLVVPAQQFMGHEGRVMGRTWLLNGEESRFNSLAAYRRLLPGETPQPILYHFSDSAIVDGVRRQLLVKSWQSPLTLRVLNTGKGSWRFEAKTSYGEVHGMLLENAETVIQVPFSGDAISEVVVDFHALSPLGKEAIYPKIVLAEH